MVLDYDKVYFRRICKGTEGAKEIVFHALFVCGLYFVQYGFMQVCIFYQFF